VSDQVCGSKATASGKPCQTPVTEPGETCWRDSHIAGSLAHLTPKQRRFVEEYTGPNLGNATQSAIAAGYSEKTAHVIGHENLSKPKIAEAVENRLDQRAMAANEILARLADMARADMANFIEIRGGGGWTLDLEKAKAAGLLHLVREVSYDSNGQPQIKLHDAKDALKQLGKVHKLFVDKVEHSGEIDTGGVLMVPGPMPPERWRRLSKREPAHRGNGAGGS